MKAQQQIKQLLSRLIAAVEVNPHSLSDEAYATLADALMIIVNLLTTTHYSREQAARTLHISVRQLQRDAKAAGITFHRDGHRNTYLTQADINRIIEYRQGK